MPLSTKEIQEALLKHLYEASHPYCVTNFDKARSFEHDIIAVSRSMLTTEYEVKVSRADFRKDFKKGKLKDGNGKFFGRGKHDLYNEALDNYTSFGQVSTAFEQYEIPNRFYYTCPPDLIREEELPRFAGLIYVSGFTLRDQKKVFHEIKVIKKAPFIHKQKAAPALIFRMCQTLTARSIYGCALMTHKNRMAKERMKLFSNG
jgi:hypothetical protein